MTRIPHISHDPETSRRLREACRGETKSWKKTVAYLHHQPGTPIETNRRIAKITLNDRWTQLREATPRLPASDERQGDPAPATRKRTHGRNGSRTGGTPSLGVRIQMGKNTAYGTDRPD